MTGTKYALISIPQREMRIPALSLMATPKRKQAGAEQGGAESLSLSPPALLPATNQ